MKKSFILFGFFFCFGGGILFGYFFGTHKWNSPDLSPISNSHISSSGNAFSGSQAIPQALLFGNIPMSQADCEKKISSTDREDCFFSLTVRGARDIFDTTRCEGLKEKSRCKKIISDEFSNQFPILPR
ncbi:hypothetical protein AUK10_03885 [Candidatus Gracilibacteria bacterium CG2_30_37_12]|nr:MAG: hypothetical protein AUK10_03885 [Candidatus Gracilibacteria bacterium CG2_30_37_12]